MLTTPDGLRTPDLTDNFNYVTDLGVLANTIQSALLKRANSFKGTAANRQAAKTAGTAAQGDSWQDTDGSKQMYVFLDGDWVVHRRRDPKVYLQTQGTALPTVRPAQPGEITAESDVSNRGGFMHTVTTWSSSEGLSFVTVKFGTPFPTAIMNVNVTPIRGTNMTAQDRFIVALDVMTREEFRVCYPAQTAAREVAFTWSAQGF